LPKPVSHIVDKQIPPIESNLSLLASPAAPDLKFPHDRRTETASFATLCCQCSSSMFSNFSLLVPLNWINKLKDSSRPVRCLLLPLHVLQIGYLRHLFPIRETPMDSSAIFNQTQSTRNQSRWQAAGEALLIM
jgi:hypothetical protein